MILMHVTARRRMLKIKDTTGIISVVNKCAIWYNMGEDSFTFFKGRQCIWN